jgi:hypothetical protein
MTTHHPTPHRCGTWRIFERRFRPIDSPDGSLCWHHEQLPADVHPTRVWTILDADGKLYVAPGFHHVNRIGYVLCAVPWTADDLHRPGYRYD